MSILQTVDELVEVRRNQTDDGVLHLAVPLRSVRQFSHETALTFQRDIATHLQQLVALLLNVIPAPRLDPLAPPTLTNANADSNANPWADGYDRVHANAITPAAPCAHANGDGIRFTHCHGCRDRAFYPDANCHTDDASDTNASRGGQHKRPWRLVANNA